MRILGNPIERLLYITLALVFIGNVLAVGFLIFLVAQSNQQLDLLQARSKAANTNTTKIIAQLKSQSDRQTAYIQCIADFFARPDRASLTLADLNSCTIMPGSAPAAANSFAPSSSSAPSKAVTSSPPRTTAAASPQASKTPVPTTPSTPAPTRQPSLIQGIVKLVNGLL